MKKKILIPAIALMLALTSICLASCTAFTLPWEKDGQTETTEPPADSSGEAESVANESNMELVSLESNDKVFLSAGPTMVKSLSFTQSEDVEMLSEEFPMSMLLGASATYLEKTLTATVLPEALDADKKLVDWSVEWINNNGLTGNVTDYVNVIPTSDGSTTAAMRAYKAFEGASIRVIVTTRYGGFSAECIVAYDGKPTSLSVSYNGTKYTSTSTIKLDASKTYYLDLNLEHVLGAGSRYGTYEITGMGGTGSFMAYKKSIVNGTVTATEEEKLEMSNLYAQFFDATIENGKVKVTIKKSVQSYVSGYPRTGTRYEYKGTYTDPRSGGVASVPLVYFVVTDTASGATALININIQSVVTGVNMSTAYYEF